jgi:integrase
VGRAAIAPGTWGTISTTGQAQVGGKWVTARSGTTTTRYRARARYRDKAGDLHTVERFAPRKGAAEASLRKALGSFEQTRRDRVLRSGMTVAEAGERWLTRVERADSGLSVSTQRQYREAFVRHVQGSELARLTLERANSVPVLRAYLEDVADNHGTGSGKTARSVVSSILRWAVEDGALSANAMRDVRPVKGDPARKADRESGRPLREARDTGRALTREQRDHVLRVADEYQRARLLDVSDLVWFMAGTGVRISEALAQQWSDVDLVAGAVLVRGTKTESSVRRIALPGWLVERLRERAEQRGMVGLVFPSPGTPDPTKPRDRRNVARVFRAVLDEAGFEWATPHTLRRTVASLIDAAGLPIALAADVLGHADAAMTARVYLGRRGDTSAAAAVL